MIKNIPSAIQNSLAGVNRREVKDTCGMIIEVGFAGLSSAGMASAEGESIMVKMTIMKQISGGMDNNVDPMI